MMKYHVVGIINDRFLSECYEAETEAEAEEKLKEYGRKLYAGQTEIIVTEDEQKWQKKIKSLKS